MTVRYSHGGLTSKCVKQLCQLYGTVMDSDHGTKPGKDERRAAILRIAHEAFLADGYAATSMSTIAARCGGSKATLYNYFSSKEELFLAVVRDRCDQVALVFDQELDVAENLEAQLQRFGEHFLGLVLADESVASYRMMIGECARFPEIGQTFYEAGPALGHTKLSVFFQGAIEKKLLRPTDTLAMARMFIHLCLADLHQRRLFNIGPKPDEAVISNNVARAVRMLLATVGPV